MPGDPIQGNEPLDDYDYFITKKVDRTYISKRLVNKCPDETTKNIRIVSKVIDSAETWTHAQLKGEVVLRISPGGRQEIKAKLYEDDRGLFCLSIQKYTVVGGAPHNTSFSFIGNEVNTLRNFMESLQFLDFSNIEKGKTDDESIEKARKLLSNAQNLDFLIKMVENNITKKDVVALAYRKEQLEIFKKLLSDDAFFKLQKAKLGKSKDENVWQYFFEINPWIFGYGLNLVFNEPLKDEKLEQTVKGFDLLGSGKRVDGLLKTKGVVSSLCLVELKTHKTPLLKELKAPYRKDCWQLSDELNGGIAQIQKTSQKTIENLGTRIEPKSNDGTPSGEKVYLYQPKSYLVVGSLSEFETQHGLNDEKYSSFELFRRNIISPEIITFDELYERAKFIVHNNEEAAKE